MGGIPINWGAGAEMNPGGPSGVVNSALAGQELGYELGQKAAIRHALNGLDFSNPASANSAVEGLVRAGAFDQGASLLKLNAARQFVSTVLPKVIDRLNGNPRETSPVAPPPGLPPALGAPGAAETHDGIMGNAQGAAEQLLATPLADRPAAAQQIRQNFIDQGVPAAAIDGHLDDLSDEGLTKTAQYFKDHMVWHAGQVAQTPGIAGTPPPDHPNDFAWARNVANDPVLNDPEIQGFMKEYLGIDVGPGAQRAIELQQPWNAKQAEAANAAQIAAEQERGKLEYAKQNAIIAAYQAGMVATAQEAARAPYQFDTYQGPNGQPVYIRKDFAKQYAAEHGGILGQGMTAAESRYQGDIGQQTAELLKPDAAARNQASDAQASAERALSIINTLKFDKATPIKNQIAQALNAAGVKGAEQYASDIAAYQQATTQALVQGAHTAFPSRITNTDIALMHQVYPTITTPNDAAALVMGTQAAQALRTQQYEDFKANYTGDHNPQAIQRAWLAGPGGQSILQNPEWSKVPIGGRPAFNPATDTKWVDAKDQRKIVKPGTKGAIQVGAWGVGTGHPVFFEMH